MLAPIMNLHGELHRISVRYVTGVQCIASGSLIPSTPRGTIKYAKLVQHADAEGAPFLCFLQVELSPLSSAGVPLACANIQGT